MQKSAACTKCGAHTRTDMMLVFVASYFCETTVTPHQGVEGAFVKPLGFMLEGGSLWPPSGFIGGGRFLNKALPI